MYYNQNNYAHVPYPSSAHPDATVKSGGCAPTCMSMIVEGLTGNAFPPPMSAAYAISIGARVAEGTDMLKQSSAIAAKYGIKVRQTKSIDDVFSAVQYNRAMVVANAKGGDTGLFSDEGHFIAIVRTQGPYAVVWDPGLYDGKYSKAWRKNKVSVYGNDIFVTPENLDADIRKDYAAYFIFEKGREEEDEMAKIIDQIAQAAGLSQEKTIKALGVLAKFTNISEERWEKDGAKYLKDAGLINTARDGRELVEFGELGVILKRLKESITK